MVRFSFACRFPLFPSSVPPVFWSIAQDIFIVPCFPIHNLLGIQSHSSIYNEFSVQVCKSHDYVILLSAT